MFLGAGFSRWAAGLPLAAELFDFAIRPRHPREARRLELLESEFTSWRERHPTGSAEEFIQWSLDAANERAAKRVIWYVTRRISDPFIARIMGGTQTLMIDDRRVHDLESVRRARSFFTSFVGLGTVDVLTSNYDMLVEYAFGTRYVHYGKPGEELFGRGKNPVDFSQGTPVRLGGIVGLAKLHGSISWDSARRYTDGRCGLTGKALIVPPRPGKSPPEALLPVWDYAARALSAATMLIVFGFAFNAYDSTLLSFLSEHGRDLRQVLLIDPQPKVAAASRVWPSAKILTMPPEFDGGPRAQELFVGAG